LEFIDEVSNKYAKQGGTEAATFREPAEDTGRKQGTYLPRGMRHEYLASFMEELRGPHSQSWQPRRKACVAWIKQIEDIGNNRNDENGQSGPHNLQKGEPHYGCCQKYGLGLDRRFHAKEHCELHNTANHTLFTQVGAQEAIIMESVMLIMEHAHHGAAPKSKTYQIVRPMNIWQ